MKNRIWILLLVMWLASSCNNYSAFPIDDEPKISVQNSLPGIWKVLNDTNAKDYILVQNNEDVYGGNELNYRHSEDLKDVWKIYLEKKENRKSAYYVTRMNLGGKNAQYRQWGGFMSVVNEDMFLNIYYANTVSLADKDSKSKYGYLLVRIIGFSAHRDTVSISVVSDETLKYLKSAKDVRQRVKSRLNDPGFYGDTMQLYKVSDYHSSLNGSIDVANK